MKLKTLTTNLLTSFLVGCGAINQNTTVQSAPTQQAARQPNAPAPPKASIFDSVSFPQETCGDKLPADPRFYPVKFYPVFIEYSESNLQTVTSQFCRDALRIFREKTGKDAIQVASFVGKERANQFKKLVQQKLRSVEIGEPTVKDFSSVTGQESASNANLFDLKPMYHYAKICRENSFPKDPENYPIKFYPVYAINPHKDQKKSGKWYELIKKKVCYDEARQDQKILVTYALEEDKAKQIIDVLNAESIEGTIGDPIVIQSPPLPQSTVAEKARLTPSHLKDLIALAKNNKFGNEVKIVLPTYIPDGFQIEKLGTRAEGSVGSPSYEIIYKNSSNKYFEVTATGGGLGGDPSGTQTIKVFSPALGNLSILYTEFSRVSNRPSITFEPTLGLIGGHLYYQVSSHGVSTVSLEEFVKVVESLQYLNPY